MPRETAMTPFAPKIGKTPEMTIIQTKSRSVLQKYRLYYKVYSHNDIEYTYTILLQNNCFYILTLYRQSRSDLHKWPTFEIAKINVNSCAKYKFSDGRNQMKTLKPYMCYHSWKTLNSIRYSQQKQISQNLFVDLNWD